MAKMKTNDEVRSLDQKCEREGQDTSYFNILNCRPQTAVVI